ncbi:GMC family oxidoreductase [Sorangium sp. So ce136]|uniref:GMC oxidoreductase n=1 Tax=Sorangium sp. So ce136 TaxID=3133284 RepID=UPI003F026B53
MPQHRAIVIGSGFGGAVAACRLAQAGIAVTVLERGRRYDQDQPRFPRGHISEWLWDRTGGMFDVRPIGQMRLLQAAGYGGGSLIYANVHLRPPPEVFANGWPEGYSREALDPYFDLVAYMLDIRPITDSPRGIPPKTRHLSEAVVKLGRKDQLFYPPLAIDFSAGSEPHLNKFGVMQQSCTYLGECFIGCSRRAKNTLDMNYLAVAERLGAQMRTECEVTRIEPLHEATRSGYRVRYRDRGRGGQEIWEEADHVFLCAGSVGSTALLLQSRDAGALPRLSRRLGEGYSGNGDLLMLDFGTTEPWEPSNGPTITTGLLYSSKEPGELGWFLLEDGGFSRHLWPLFDLAAPNRRWRRYPSGLRLQVDRAPGADRPAIAPSARDIDREIRMTAEEMIPFGETTPEPGRPSLDTSLSRMVSTASFLAMGRDLADGRIELSSDKKIRLRWDVPRNLMIYSLQERLARDLVGELGGRFTTSLFWRFAHLPASVHNLGGCRMGKGPDEGVTSDIGEVFNYPNLFVLDGGILPSSTGVNPSHTIAAVAERNIERIIRRVIGNSEWRAPERKLAQPYRDPLSQVVIPAEGTAPPKSPGVGLTIRETMVGHWRSRAARPGVAPIPLGVACRLQITIGYLARFIADPTHPGLVTGKIYVGGLTAGAADVGGGEVQEGVWNLFVAHGEGPERAMRYVLPFVGEDGRSYTLSGTKAFRPNPGLRLWRENTVLDFTIHEGADTSGPVVGAGRVKIPLVGVLRLLLSLRVTGRDEPGEKVRAVLGFIEFYVRELAHVSWPSSWLTDLLRARPESS